MTHSEAYTVRARITYRQETGDVIVADHNGGLPVGDFINNPETSNTDEGFARELARRALGRTPSSLLRTHRQPGSAVFHFVVDEYPTTPDTGYRWHPESTESAVEA